MNRETRTVILRLDNSPAAYERWAERADEIAAELHGTAHEEGLKRRTREADLASEIRAAVAGQVEAADGLGLDLLTDALSRVEWQAIGERFLDDAMDRQEEEL